MRELQGLSTICSLLHGIPPFDKTILRTRTDRQQSTFSKKGPLFISYLVGIGPVLDEDEKEEEDNVRRSRANLGESVS